LVPLLASVQDPDRMREIMSTWRPDTVYHAAAYKHVPLVEHNPAAGIKNNVSKMSQKHHFRTEVKDTSTKVKDRRTKVEEM
jgi:FlaA1/EpsC-like NDP-sugar epimerase